MSKPDEEFEIPKDAGNMIKEFGELPPGTIISESWLAKRFGRVPESVKRAVNRGEIPAPAQLFGQSRWTIGSIVRHMEKRIEQETQILNAERAISRSSKVAG